MFKNFYCLLITIVFVSGCRAIDNFSDDSIIGKEHLNKTNIDNQDLQTLAIDDSIPEYLKFPFIENQKENTNFHLSEASKEFIYNSYNNSYYISLSGFENSNTYIDNLGNKYFDEPAEIEKFYSINDENNKVDKILNYGVSNISLYNNYVYFLDDKIIKRINNNHIEEVCDVNKYLNYDYFFSSFFIDNDKIYIFSEEDGKIYVLDFETKEVISNMEYEFKSKKPLFQIQNETIYELTKSGLYFKIKDKDENLFYFDSPEFNNFILENNFYFKSFIISNNMYFTIYNIDKENLEVYCFDGTNIEFISECSEDYTISNVVKNNLYIINKNRIFAYNTKTKKLIEKFKFGEESDTAQIYNMQIENNKYYLSIRGGLGYSNSRIAEFDFDNENIRFLTDYFEPKTEISFFNVYPGFISIEYDNKYAAYDDTGSSGGLILNNYKDNITLNVNPLPSQIIEIDNTFFETISNEGHNIYYKEYNNNFFAYMEVEAIQIRIYFNTIDDANESKKQFIDLIKSIKIYKEGAL